MNITEFAEQIVFGTTLAEKLAPPCKLSMDVGKAPDLKHLRSPGRSPELAMHNGPGVSQPPKDRELGNEKARGRLLHFLANHELLATELMALVLLKFPEAPHAFKRGVLVTLQEEQEHTRLYMQRMQQCGVEFGAFPLSGHFWRVVEPMQSPMDFVSRLSLTFEQANLDYSLHFAHVFNRLDDTQTAAILRRIYQDEIGHVQHGLHWFRQWKNPEHSDWQAYQHALQFPMSPQRGRGPTCAFNRAGRRQAGLTDEFIDAIEVFRQSRGRPPTVRWFDAGAESELNGIPSSKERALLMQLTTDLEGVMIPLASQDDVQLVRSIPPVDFRKTLLDAGLHLPEFILIDEATTLGQRKLRDLAPWAWTPRSHQLADTFRSATQQPTPQWHNGLAELFRKSWCARHVKEWLKHDDTPAWMAGSTPNSIVTTTQQVEVALFELHERGYSAAIFKSDLSTSGRNQRRLACESLSESDRQYLEAHWSNGSIAVVEPELDRILDISFLWEQQSADDQAKFLGWSRPIVTGGRRYSGTRLHRPFADCDGELKQFLLADDCGRLRATRNWLTRHLLPELAGCGFAYHFGVDTFVHRAADGELRLHPLVELNPRLTMGHVAMALRKHIAPVTDAEFRIFSKTEWREIKATYADMPFEKSENNRWQRGLLPLCHVNAQTKLVPAILVGLRYPK